MFMVHGQLHLMITILSPLVVYVPILRQEDSANPGTTALKALQNPFHVQRATIVELQVGLSEYLLTYPLHPNVGHKATVVSVTVSFHGIESLLL